MRHIIVAMFCVCFASQALSLSFQTPDDVKSNMIVAEDAQVEPSNSNQREEMRKMRLYILGALTEQLVAWFFQDIIPKEVMRRTRRSLNVPGDFKGFRFIIVALNKLSKFRRKGRCFVLD